MFLAANNHVRGGTIALSSHANDPSIKNLRPKSCSFARHFCARQATPRGKSRSWHARFAYIIAARCSLQKSCRRHRAAALKRLSDSLRAILRTDRRPHDQFTALSTTASKPQPPRGPPPHRGIPSVAAGASERARRRGPTRGSAAGRTRRSPCARRGGAGLKPRRRPGAASR